MILMPRRRRQTVLCVMVPFAMAACLARFPAPSLASAGPTTFDPTRFFGGETEGHGTLRVRMGADRAVRVHSVGTTQSDGAFRLDQSVQLGNDPVETRTWLLRRVDEQHFTAVLSDARGPVRAESHGNVFHLRYRLRRAVYMEQWLTLRADGSTVDNRAQITVLGVSWARLSETIARRGPDSSYPERRLPIGSPR